MKLLITSGGSREPIDDVRYVGNRSSGRLGALIAEEAVRRYHQVDLFHGAGAALPGRWALETGLLRVEAFGSVADLGRRLERRMTDRTYDAIIHAAALADFTPRAVPGKLRSEEHETLTLVLDRAPKLAPRLRQLAPAARFVMFKLEPDGGDQERARRAMQAAGADLVVLNPVSALGEGAHPATILTGSEILEQTATKGALAAALLAILERGG